MDSKDKPKTGKAIIVVLILALVGWLIYDNLIASHWVIVFNTKGDRTYYTIDNNGEKFRDGASCLQYATNLNATGVLFDYQCGYRCKQIDTQPFVSCEKWT